MFPQGRPAPRRGKAAGAWSALFCFLPAILLVPQPALSQQAERTRTMDVAQISEVTDYFSRQHKHVLTFCGYSGSGYEDPEAMLREATRILEKHDPKKTIVNCGATSAGIGKVYELARERGFATTGIVSALAKEYPDDISPHVQLVFFVKDDSWGGFVGDSEQLSPTSQAMVASGDEFVAIGGGAVARDELIVARKAGKPVRFLPAEMNHAKAIAKAKKKNQPVPREFRGAAHEVFGK
jgi:hypothetical protein